MTRVINNGVAIDYDDYPTPPRMAKTPEGSGTIVPTFIGSTFANGQQNVTVAIPAGTVAGDRAFIFASGGNYCREIPGWSSVSQHIGNGWSYNLFTKVLEPADIGAGSILVPFNGSFGEHAVMLTFKGSAPRVGWLDMRHSTPTHRPAFFGGYPYGVPKLEAGMTFAALTARVNQTHTLGGATLLHDSKRATSASSLTFFEVPWDNEGAVVTPSITADGNYDHYMVRFHVVEPV